MRIGMMGMRMRMGTGLGCPTPERGPSGYSAKSSVRRRQVTGRRLGVTLPRHVLHAGADKSEGPADELLWTRTS